VTAVLEGPVLVGEREPRICVHPAGERHAGQLAVDLARRSGLLLDPWQALVLQRSLGVQDDGRWSSFEVGLIVARQNGKSAIFEARMLAGLFLFDEELILYSAHEFKTAGEIFRRVLALIERTPNLRKRVKAVARSKGEEGIELLPTERCPLGQRLRFVARSTNSGRGFSADLTIWDECQNLPDASVDAMMPTLLARRNPQLWYGGSAADKDLAPCEQITRVRNRALEGGDAADRLSFFEWSAQLCSDQCAPGCAEHDDPADPAVWARCNPALGGRVSLEAIAKMHASMSSRGFARELLSVGNYPTDKGGWEVISEAAWTATADPQSQPLDPVAFAIDVTPDRSMASIAVAGARPDGLIHLEVVDHRSGTGWVVERMQQLIERWSPCAVALDPGGPAGSLLADFDEAGIELTKPKARDAAGACGALFDAVVRPADVADWAPSLRHIPHPGLNSALAGAGKRPLGDAWAWDRRGTSVDICPLVAVTLARWAYATRPRESAVTLEGALMA
jgi:hypothetical protein